MVNKTYALIVLLAAIFAAPAVSAEDSLKKAAVFGDADAQFELGSMYYHGHGDTPKNYQKAVRYLTKASEQGHEKATLILANMHLNGEGVETGPSASFRLLHAAAWKGLPNAQAILGMYYCDGIGVEKDISQCCAWYDVAAAQGVAEAQKALAETVPKMTRGQIVKATAVSKELWRKIVEARRQP